MKDWFRFIGSNKRLLNFGFMFNFFSSFGQTFFISLFVPFWVATLSITNAAFGTMYAFVTIFSAFLLSLSGKYIDQMPLRKFGLIVFSGLMVSVIILSQSYNVVVLMIGLFMVRWCGQGLMTHTSSNGIAKNFDSNIGKALGFAALGHPVGQFILPILILPLIALVGWRSALIYTAIAAIVLVLPALWAITPVTSTEPVVRGNFTGSKGKSTTYFRSSLFWTIAVNIFLIPFIITAVMLYQYTIGQSKGWEVSWVAFSFAFFAIFNGVALLLSGNLVDKYSGIKLFPLYLIPAMLALVAMFVFSNKWVFPVFYALLGVSTGLGTTIKTAILAEIYGIVNLGRIRSYFSTILVISTALGPPVFGYFIDRQISIDQILLISGGVVFVVILLSFTVKKNI